jgi:predicted transcriptional regulator
MATNVITKKRHRKPAEMIGPAMKRAEVVALMRAEQGDMTLREYAKILHVTAAALSDIYNERRNPGPKILKRLKICRKRVYIVEYTYFKIAA